MYECEKLPEICNNNLGEKYYKIMKIQKIFFGQPKICSNYTSKSQIIEIIEIQAIWERISDFYRMMKNDIFSMISSKTHRISHSKTSRKMYKK